MERGTCFENEYWEKGAQKKKTNSNWITNEISQKKYINVAFFVARTLRDAYRRAALLPALIIIATEQRLLLI